MVHSSTRAVSRPTKKRPIPNFTCTSCQSTFDTRYKMKKHVQQVHEQNKNIEKVDKKEEDLIAKTDNLNDRIVCGDQENTDEDQTDDEEKKSPPRKSQKSNYQDKNEVDILSEIEGDKIENEMLTDDLEERIKNLIRVKPSTEPSLSVK